MKSYIVWDLETTGLQKEKAEIIEIGAMHVKDGEIVEEKSWLLNHNIPIEKITTDITGITKEMIDTEGMEPQQALKEFVEILVKEEYNITHNGMKFDIPWLIYHLGKHLSYNHDEQGHMNARLMKGMQDTAVIVKAKKMGMAMRPGTEFRHFAYDVMNTPTKGIKYNLGLCCEEMGIEIKDQHRALADVKMTQEIYKKLTEKQK